MVKAYKDNFLMSSISFDECFAIHCNASTTDDDIAELTKIAGSKDGLDIPDGAPSAPPLEYDLEAELAQALNTDTDGASVAKAASAEPVMEFTGLIEEEFDKAMTEQAALLEQEVAQPETVSEPAPVEPSPVAAAEPVAEPISVIAPTDPPEPELPVSAEAHVVEPTTEDNNSAFADQLAKLLSEQDAAPVEEVVAPSIGEADLTDPAPEVEAAPSLSPKLPVFMPETTEPEVVVADPAEVVEVVDPPRDYSDPAAEFQSFAEQPAADIPAPAPVVPEPFRPSFDAKPIETVLGASAALGAAAVGVRTASSEEEQPAQLPSVATLESAEPEFTNEFETAFNEPLEVQQEELVIPTPDMLGPDVERGAGGRKVAFVVLAVALLGGVGAMASNFLGNSGADAPVLMADGGAVKVKPKEAGGEVVPNQDQTVYKTVNGTSQQTEQKTLADNTEQPIEMAKVTPAKRESRVSDAQISNDGSTGRLVPRTVRTSVVKPDGTIITSEVDPNASSVDLARLQPASTTTPSKVKTVKIAPSISGGGDEAATLAAPKAVETISQDVAKTVMPKGVVEIRASEPKAAPKAVAPAKPVKIAKVETKAPKTVVKRVAPKRIKPVKKAKAAPKAAAPKAAETNLPSVSSPYAVQISSQRSPEAAQAAWRKLSKRYASVLRGQSPDIRRVKLEGKGIYYRVRVPASSKASAGSICSKLKKRGGSCFVTR